MKIRVAGDLQSDSIVDGLGVRTVLWTQGCGHHCPNCHNPLTWDFDGGELVEVDEVIERIYELECQDGITFSGGDPFYQAEACALIARAIKKTKMNIWCYTGFTFEQLIKMSKKDKTIMDFLKNIDVLVDGPFIQKLHSYNLKFKGSSNQRIIDVKKTLKEGKVVLYKLDEYVEESNFGRYKNEGLFV